MDAQDWHKQATRPASAAPAPLPPESIATLSDGALVDYADRVRAGLRAVPMPSPRHEQISLGLSAALRSAHLEPSGARTILALSAPFTAGKTTQVKLWAQHLYRQWTGARRGDPIPTRETATSSNHDIAVCYVTLLAATRANDLYSQLLRAMGYPIPRLQREMADRVMKAFTNHRPRLVILDDAHMLHTRQKVGRETLDAVKHINTELGEVGGVLLLVGAGLSGGEALSDPQIAGRLSEHTLTTYGIDTHEQRDEWQQFLRRCEARLLPYLPRNERGDLTQRMARYVWERSQGYVGDATKLLVDGTVTAIAQQAALDRAMLETVTLSQRATNRYAETVAAKRRADNRRPKSP